MLRSMIPRAVCLIIEDPALREFVECFFIAQGWDVVRRPPNDLIVFDGVPGMELVRDLRRQRDETPGLLLRRERLRMRGIRFSLGLDPPFTPDRLRDACGALLRRRIKLVPKRKAS